MNINQEIERVFAETTDDLIEEMKKAGFSLDTQRISRTAIERFGNYFLSGAVPEMNVPPRKLRK